jgi:hypothetical protein
MNIRWITAACLGLAFALALALPCAVAAPPNSDFNRDGIVTKNDLVILRANFGVISASAQGDADRDGRVDGTDFLIWQRQLGLTIFPELEQNAARDGRPSLVRQRPVATPIVNSAPEPSSAVLSFAAVVVCRTCIRSRAGASCQVPHISGLNVA